MIGRTLSKAFSILGQIGLNMAGSDSLLLDFADIFQYLVLPVEKKMYFVYEDKRTGEPKMNVCNTLEDSCDGWSRYFMFDQDIKRAVAKAFENRRKVKIGEEFVLKNVHQGNFNFPVDYSVKRLGKDIVSARSLDSGSDTYLISNSKKNLLELEMVAECDVPVLYRGVIF